MTKKEDQDKGFSAFKFLPKRRRQSRCSKWCPYFAVACEECNTIGVQVVEYMFAFIEAGSRGNKTWYSIGTRGGCVL